MLIPGPPEITPKAPLALSPAKVFPEDRNYLLFIILWITRTRDRVEPTGTGL